MSFIKTIKKYIPRNIKKAGLSIYESFLISRSKAKHKKVLAEVRKKEKIKVAFFLIHSSIWKYDGVYRLMEKDDRFDPVVVVCPFISFGRETMIKEMNKAIEFCIRKEYKTICTYNEAGNIWLDVKKEVKPDLVFFTNPHKLTYSNYYINYWQDTLTFYVQYAFHVSHLQEEQYNQLFHNLLWKAFYETPIHLKMARDVSRNKGKNVIITGYPGTDIYLDKNYTPKKVWKKTEGKKKRIIWAPHHTILENDVNLGYSCFLKYSNDFLKLVEKYSDVVQFAFKPHPILKPKLYNHPDWGKDKTDDYFLTWSNLSNTQLEENEYSDLFVSSDALILDSGSFMTEYLYTNKPSLFTVRNNDIVTKFNEFGKSIFKQLYHAYNITDIENFIDEVVIKENDERQNVRQEFILNNLIPPNNCSASANIYNYLINEIFQK